MSLDTTNSGDASLRFKPDLVDNLRKNNIYIKYIMADGSDEQYFLGPDTFSEKNIAL